MTQPPTPAPELPPIYLASDSASRSRRPEEMPSWLARRFRLDVFGHSLLSRRAVFEMNRAAVVLLIILVFETTLWFAVFNSIFYADLKTFGEITWLAAFLALVFGLIIALTSCHFGLSTKGGAVGVGRSVNAAVVGAALGIVMSDYFLTYLLT